MEIKLYLKSDGRSPFHEWLNDLDGSLKYRVQARITKLKYSGHFGMSKVLDDNLFELKFDFGGGIRLYYGIENSVVVILLCGGNKGTQDRDIMLAKKYWKNYLMRKLEDINE